ncbi:MAG: hypothetical protein WCO58_01315 [bacterium]
MIGKKVFISLFGFLLLCSVAQAVDFANVGIIQKNIWYSKDEPQVGDTIKIYTLLWNGSVNTLTTTVSFFDSGVLIGKRSVSVNAKTTKDVAVDWKVTGGTHKISASVSNSIMTDTTGKKIQAVLEDTSTGEDLIVIKNPIIPVNASSTSIDDPAKNLFENTLNSLDSFRTKTSDSLERAQAEAKADMGVPLTADDMKKLWSVAHTIPDAVDMTGATSTDATVYENKLKDFSHATSVQELKDSNSLKKPLAYLKYYGIGLLLFLFSNKLFFYGAIGLIIILILRIIIGRRK